MSSSEPAKKASPPSLDDVRRKLQEADRELRDLNVEAEAVLIELTRKDILGNLEGPGDDAAKS